MTLTFGLSNTRDLFAKLRRDADLLVQEVTSDRLFNFAVTGYSLIDWLRNDPAIPASANCQPIIDALHADPWLKVCGDICTASKHFLITQRVPITASAASTQGFGVGRWGKGASGIGEESIDIQLNDGTSFTCLDLVNGVLTAWESFFLAHGI